MFARFKAGRDEEYEEVLAKYADFDAEIAKETAASHFTCAELEENDVDLKKLQSWPEKFASSTSTAQHWLPEAEQRLETLGGIARRLWSEGVRWTRRGSLNRNMGNMEMKPVDGSEAIAKNANRLESQPEPARWLNRTGKIKGSGLRI